MTTGRLSDGDSALLRYLTRAGVITDDVARAAEKELAEQARPGLPEWLVKKGILGGEELAQAIANVTRHPYVNLPGVALDSTATGVLKEETATRYRVVPLRALEGVLVVATANPLDRDALRALEFASGRRVHVEVASPTAINDALDHAYHLDASLDAYLQGVREEDTAPVAQLHEEAADTKALLRDAEMPPVVKLLNLILAEGVRSHASDIHIEADVSVVRVRYRIDGILEEAFRLPKWVQDPLIARCKVLAKLDITEKRTPQDGRINVRYHDSLVDLRVSSLPTQFGEKLTMRILDPSGTPNGIDWLGLAAKEAAALREAIDRPEGVVLVTGPTGSGKTTTLYSMIAEVSSPETNIVTIENPIEYQMRGVNQVEINERQGLTFASTLRSILRQDPDVILVGEIRDQETAEIAVRAAQTGHLVLSTLHTNDAVATIARLLDLGIEPFMLAASINAIVAQRLVRRVCERCAEPYEPDPALLKKLHLPLEGHVYKRGTGCNACRKSGYAGRLGVYEILVTSQKMRKLIETKATDSAMRAQARLDGMVSLIEHAQKRILAGQTTVDEVARCVDVGAEGGRCPNCGSSIEDTYSVCPNCATALQQRCSGCQNTVQKGWQVCPYCGKALQAPVTVAVVEAPAPTPPPPPAVAPPVVAVPEPRVAPTPTRPVAPAVPSAAASGMGRSYKALVVDDQPDMRALITFTLERSGMSISVVAASSGAEALERVAEVKPDVVILDVMMPEMDGFAVCEKLRANVRTAFIPILMLTALDDADNRTRGFLAGTDDYLGKPFSRSELLARVRRLLERSYGAGAEAAAGPSRGTAPNTGGEPVVV